VFGPLEYDYPVRLTLPGEEQTAKSAELFAAISAMHQEPWSKEGFDRIVLATDSRYVFDGVSGVHKWKEEGWKFADGSPVENRDLWEALIDEFRELEKEGTLAQFWLIPREWNEADEYAKEAAVSCSSSDVPRQNG
jgi:ribonuclease HI